MSTSTPRMRRPITRDGAGDPAEFTIAADVGKPTATTDPNVYPIPSVGVGEPTQGKGEVDEQWQVKTRVSGTGAAAAVIDYRLWVWDEQIGEWHSSTWLKAPGDDAATDAIGMVQDLPGVLGSVFVGVEVAGLVGDQELHILHMRR